MIACAESCTGGMVAAALTELPGSSAIFDRGFVTYTNVAKIDLLGVSAATLDVHGAVSEQVALEMARDPRLRLPCRSPASQAPVGQSISPKAVSVSGSPRRRVSPPKRKSSAHWGAIKSVSLPEISPWG